MQWNVRHVLLLMYSTVEHRLSNGSFFKHIGCQAKFWTKFLLLLCHNLVTKQAKNTMQAACSYWVANRMASVLSHPALRVHTLIRVVAWFSLVFLVLWIISIVFPISHRGTWESWCKWEGRKKNSDNNNRSEERDDKKAWDWCWCFRSGLTEWLGKVVSLYHP